VGVRAVALAYSPPRIEVAAGEAVTITMQNQDPGVSHDLSVPGRGKTDACSGPCSTTLSVNLAPGVYNLVCTVHPGMTGEVVAR
jgi:plastocyanin